MISIIRKTFVNAGKAIQAPNLVNFDPETAENAWRVFAYPLNFRIFALGDCQPYRMDVI